MTKSNKTVRKRASETFITSIAEFNKIYFPNPAEDQADLVLDPFKLGEQTARKALASLTKAVVKSRRKSAN